MGNARQDARPRHGDASKVTWDAWEGPGQERGPFSSFGCAARGLYATMAQEHLRLKNVRASAGGSMQDVVIRQAVQADLNPVMEVYASARRFMKETGNPTQWGDDFPPRELIDGRICRGELYVLAQEGAIHAAFALILGPDPTYARIEGGSWESDSPYGTLHQVASDGSVRGVFQRAVDFSLGRRRHLRVDTHADNKVMQAAILRAGFQYRGIIYVRDHSPRLAYELVA